MAAEGDAHGVQVLYIAGSGRSGSTLVSCLLGQHDDVFAAGEMRYLWRRGVIENRLCGCGLPFAECPTWQNVIAAAGGLPGDVAAADDAQRRATRMRSLAFFLCQTRRQRQRGAREHLSAVYDVYRALANHDGVSVIVDSSKLPTYALALLELPDVRVTIVHLVRDPRATAFSWQRWRQLPDVLEGTWMQRQSPLKSAVLWLLWNLVTESIVRARARGRYLRIRYEDLVQHPSRALDDIRRLAGCAPYVGALRPGASAAVSLEPTHTVAGNPGRMKQGEIAFVPDVEWRCGLRRRDRWLVTAVTLPLLRRYGYRARLGSEQKLSEQVLVSADRNR